MRHVILVKNEDTRHKIKLNPIEGNSTIEYSQP